MPGAVKPFPERPGPAKTRQQLTKTLWSYGLPGAARCWNKLPERPADGSSRRGLVEGKCIEKPLDVVCMPRLVLESWLGDASATRVGLGFFKISLSLPNLNRWRCRVVDYVAF